METNTSKNRGTKSNGYEAVIEADWSDLFSRDVDALPPNAEWQTADEIAEALRGKYSSRTVRQSLSRKVDQGRVERRKYLGRAAGGLMRSMYHYRIVKKAAK